jgi:leucyl-tRNA synthetase
VPHKLEKTKKQINSMNSAEYNHRTIEKKHIIERASVNPKDGGEPCYILEMFPYPSGKIHMGHVRNYMIGDVAAVYKHLKGFHVIHPIGWDSFGLPAENAAREKGEHPAKWTVENINGMREQLKRIGFMFHYDRELKTVDPDYIQLQQAMFLKFYQSGLVTRAEAAVNWDPKDQTVLANEQVIDGKGWRSGVPVERKMLKQWFVKITDFAEDLLKGLETLPDWPAKVVQMQKKWIGAYEGFDITFQVKRDQAVLPDTLTVFTTKPETVFGLRYVAICSDHVLVKSAVKSQSEIKKLSKALAVKESDIQADDEKIGYDTGLTIIHPFTGEEFPVYVANYVLSGHGSGAVFGCPAHDARDFEFAKKYHLSVTQVIASTNPAELPLCDYTDEAMLENSGAFTGVTVAKTREMLPYTKGVNGEFSIVKSKRYRLRDWGVSRQRFWGCPIPMIHCEDCGIVPVPSEDLPVLLPEKADFTYAGNPLDANTEWKHTDCPKCKKPATRETDTLDTFFDSSWYFLKYLGVQGSAQFSKETISSFMPVHLYVGGIEHAVLHLLYARFFTKALHSVGEIDIQEPFQRLFTQGMVCHEIYKDENGVYLFPEEIKKAGTGYVHVKTGKPITVEPHTKMSKSKKNVIDPDDAIDMYGADTVRMFIISDSPPEKDMIWSDEGISGVHKFIKKLWSVLQEAPQTQVIDGAFEREIRVILKAYETFIEELALNKAVAKIYELYNRLIEQTKKHSDRQVKFSRSLLNDILICLYPIIPFLSAELYQHHGFPGKIQDAEWSDFSQVQAVKLSSEVAVQIAGKTRGTVTLETDATEEIALAAVKQNPGFEKYFEGKTVRKIIYVQNKIINYVVS